MSVLLLLSGSAGATSAPAPAPAETGLPATSDATIQAMRPAGRRIALYTVGPTGDYTTIGAAMTAAKDAQTAAGKQTSIAWNSDGKDMGPDYRVDIVIAAGTYNEVVGTGEWINLYGATGNPADVIITSDAAGEGTLRAWGSCHVEGITIRSTMPSTGTGQKYPLHLTAGAHTLTMAKCRIETTNTVATGGGAAIGMDGAAGSYTLFYDTDINGATSRVTNMHGWDYNTVPLTLAFINCRTTGEIYYTDLASNQEDKVYVIGGSVGSVTVTGTAAVTTIGANTVTGTVTATNRVNSETWPKPVDGLQSSDRAFYYPSKIGTALDLTPAVTDAAPMTVSANRVYYVPITITDALHVTGAGVDVTTAVGKVNTYRAVQRGGTAPTPLFVAPASTTLTTGKVYEQFYYFKDFYPGEGRVWVRMRFDAAAQVKGSASLPGLVDCYYEDQPSTEAAYVPNLIKVTSGTPVPLPFIRAGA